MTNPQQEAPASRMTLGVHVLRADGTRVELRPVEEVKVRTDWRPGDDTYPKCRCPRHRKAEENTK